MNLTRNHLHGDKDKELSFSIRVQKRHHLITTLPLAKTLLRLGHLVVLLQSHGMVVLIEAHLDRPFIVRVIRNKEVRTISNKETLFVKGTVLAKHPHHAPI